MARVHVLFIVCAGAAALVQASKLPLRNCNQMHQAVDLAGDDPTPVFLRSPFQQPEQCYRTSQVSQETGTVFYGDGPASDMDDSQETDMLPDEYVDDVMSEREADVPWDLLDEEIDMLPDEYGNDSDIRLPASYYSASRVRRVKPRVKDRVKEYDVPMLPAPRVNQAGQSKRILKNLISASVDGFYQKIIAYGREAARPVAPLGATSDSSPQAMTLRDAVNAADKGHFVFLLYWDASSARIQAKYPYSAVNCANVDKHKLSELGAIPEYFLTVVEIRLPSQYCRVKNEIDSRLDTINQQLPDLSKATLPPKTML
ncbi:hypothetical protein H4R34_004610 [Dimargaris verticillata]|uniref:Uncharacterized protein n=1 Tax=Dimargaris verticillata TaxID=2761393 RepID=A0A9W8B4J9_9FUNG|nr:hypothetical protein H4R34_004610 [Dimargaris verticillata]